MWHSSVIPWKAAYGPQVKDTQFDKYKINNTGYGMLQASHQ
jgi:hypothetical protein